MRSVCSSRALALLSSVALLLGCSGDDEPQSTGGAGGMQVSGSGGSAAGGSGGAVSGGIGGSAGVMTGSGGASGGAGGSGGQPAMDSGAGDAEVDAAIDAEVDAEPADAGEPSDCDPVFMTEDTCDPEIEFQNDEAEGDGAMFDQVIPDPIATMREIACRVCTILYRDPSEVTKRPDAIRLRIYDFDGVANAGGGVINLSSRHVANYEDPDDARFEYIGVLLHETAHLYQFDDGGGGLVEGMADFVRIRAGHHRLDRRDPGGAWTDAYTTSGFFFSWLAGPGGLQPDGRVPADPDIGWAINQQMKDNWTTDVFVDRLDTDVDTLWTEYQAAIE